MGKWSFHPMGNDDALNVRDLFFDAFLSKDIDIYEDKEKVKKSLEKLTVKDIDQFMKENVSWREFNTYDYVLAYLYVEYKAFDVSTEVKEKLKQCLRDSIDAFLNPYPDDRAPKHVLYRNILGFSVPKESIFYTLYCLETFLDKFDDVFLNKHVLEKDVGLIETMSNPTQSKPESNEESEAFLGLKFCYTEGWGETLGRLGGLISDINKRREFYLKFARNGDIVAQELLLSEWSRSNHINEEVSLEVISLLFDTLNSGVFNKDELDNELSNFLLVRIYGYYLYKKILANIYKFIYKNRRDDLLDKFISVCLSYQGFEKVYFNSDDVPDYYGKKDRVSIYNFLTLDVYNQDLSAIAEFVSLDIGEKIDIHIPKSFNCQPVTKLFYYIDGSTLEGIDTLYIPSTLEMIGDDELIFDDDLTGNEKMVFPPYCVNDLVVEEGNPSITEVNGLFYSKDLTRLVFCPKNKFKDIVVEDSVTSVDCNVFWGYTDLNSITLGNKIKDMDGTMFLSCGNLKVNYKGTKEEFLSISGVGHNYISIVEYPEYANNKVIIYCTDGDIDYVDWLKNPK